MTFVSSPSNSVLPVVSPGNRPGLQCIRHSMLARSAVYRVLLSLVVLTGLWLAVMWAVAIP